MTFYPSQKPWRDERIGTALWSYEICFLILIDLRAMDTEIHKALNCFTRAFDELLTIMILKFPRERCTFIVELFASEQFEGRFIRVTKRIPYKEEGTLVKRPKLLRSKGLVL